MIEDMAKLFAGPHLPAAVTARLDRRFILHGPGHLVEAVNVLLDDVIARQPGEIEPVAQLPFHVAPVRLARLVPQCARVVGAVQGHNVADGAVVDALHRLALGVFVAITEAGHNRQILLLRFTARFEDGANAGRVDGYGLFAEDVFAGGDGGLEMCRPKVRRRAEQHHVANGDDVLIRVEAGEQLHVRVERAGTVFLGS